MTDFRGPDGKPMDPSKRADQLMGEADKIRKGIGSLTSDAADPMAKSAEAITKSEEHLKGILAQLTPSGSASKAKK
jgi:hypothetical protein